MLHAGENRDDLGEMFGKLPPGRMLLAERGFVEPEQLSQKGIARHDRTRRGTKPVDELSHAVDGEQAVDRVQVARKEKHHVGSFFGDDLDLRRQRPPGRAGRDDFRRHQRLVDHDDGIHLRQHRANERNRHFRDAQQSGHNSVLARVPVQSARPDVGRHGDDLHWRPSVPSRAVKLRLRYERQPRLRARRDRRGGRLLDFPDTHGVSQRLKQRHGLFASPAGDTERPDQRPDPTSHSIRDRFAANRSNDNFIHERPARQSGNVGLRI